MNDYTLPSPFEDSPRIEHRTVDTARNSGGIDPEQSQAYGGHSLAQGFGAQVHSRQVQEQGQELENHGEMAMNWSMGPSSFLPTDIGNSATGVASSGQHGMNNVYAQHPQHLSPSSIMQSASASTSNHNVDRNNNFLTLLAEMPNATDDPARHTMWMQAVQYKTKSLELDIAEARRKEREAELELARLKAVVDRRSSFRRAEPQPSTPQGNMAALAPTGAGGGMGGVGAGGGQSQSSSNQNNMPNTGHLQLNVPLPRTEQTYVPSTTRSHSFTTATYPYLHTRPMLGPAVSPQNQKPSTLPDVSVTHPHPGTSSMLGTSSTGDGTAGNREQAMTPFDLEAILSGTNLDNMFSWLPDFGNTGMNGTSASGIPGMSQGGIDPNALRFASTNPMDAFNGSAIELDTDYIPDFAQAIKAEPDYIEPSPAKRKGSSGAESAAADDLPPIKRSRRGIEKKVTVEQTVYCPTCRKSIARVLVRALRSQLPDHIVSEFSCLKCTPVARPAGIPDPAISGTAIGTVETRKRLRAGLEMQDEENGVDARRQFCDVCQRIIGSGWIKGGKAKMHIGHLAEIICSSCDARYQRCTDCGGGGGPRLNVGKWRLKEVFPPGRKTCSLSHSRLGDRQRDIGVHVTPSDFTPEQLSEVLARCKGLWQEKNLSRLAVPEMMEMDLPANLINPLHSYADIEKIIVENWPAREGMIKAEGADPERFKRILGLTWAHTKPRRTVRTVDIEEEHSRVAVEGNGEDADRSTVLENVRKTNVVIPAGCELIGMWGGEWDMQHGSLLISTFIPFEGTDGEDSAALSVGEIISKVQNLQAAMNDEIDSAGQEGGHKAKVPACEHLWVVSGSTVPLVRERMADILTRKRSFVHLEEYLTRHPDFANAVKDRPYGLHPSSLALPQSSPDKTRSKTRSNGKGDMDADAEAQEDANARPLILARWLGNDFGPDKIREIKEMEFGGKAKLRRKAKKGPA